MKIPTIPITRRKNFAAAHNRLDPYIDRGKILEQLISREFPIEFLLAAEIAQLRTFSFPNGTRLLHATREFENNSLKRLDDTRAILVEMGRHGFESAEATEMADHLNKIHGFYNIPNDEFLHTLSTFIFDVQLFIDRFGWRSLTRAEELAIYYTYVDMGNLMKIEDIPETDSDFWVWRVRYEAEHQAYAETNYLVSEGLFKGAKEMVPAMLRPFIKPFVFSLEGQRFAELLGYRWPNPLVRNFFLTLMWIRKQFNKRFTIWDRLSFEETLLTGFKTYPNGYNRLRLGPDKLVKIIEKQRQTEEESNISETV